MTEPKCKPKPIWLQIQGLSHFTTCPYKRCVLLLLLLSRFSCVRPCATHRRQPTRLPRPWDSPGKNTGVGCHFLLQCMKVKSESEVAQLCPTLRDPMDCSPPVSSIYGIFQARVLEWLAVAFSGSDVRQAFKCETVLCILVTVWILYFYSSKLALAFLEAPSRWAFLWPSSGTLRYWISPGQAEGPRAVASLSTFGASVSLTVLGMVVTLSYWRYFFFF